ncbi:chitin synthase [Schizophyllum commune]
MAFKRKPVPRSKTPQQDALEQPRSGNPSPSGYNASSSRTAAPQDAPDPALSEAYEDIRNAVARMTGDGLYDEERAPLVPDQRNSLHPDNAYARPTSEFRRYQPGQYLEPILTGETLQLDEANTPSSSDHTNPFSDTHTPTSSRPQSGYYGGYPAPASDDSHATATNTNASTTQLDHFAYDAEAYASGHYSRAAYQAPPPRSRSPTPGILDDDYYIQPDGSVSYSPEKAYPMYRESPEKEYPPYPTDPEKADPQTEYFLGYDQKPYQQGYDYGAPVPGADADRGTLSSESTEPETPVETRHFGPAPSGRIVRRRKTKKRVQLTNGNYVVDLDVPPKLVLPRKGVPETMRTRYTAVTCDPDDFERSGFFLRQNEMARQTELFIVITMYNEDEVLFCRTLYGVMKNIQHLCSRKNSQTWGPKAWEKVVVCIVADGRKKVHPRVLDCLTLLGVYQPGKHMVNTVNNVPVTAHLFEYTTSFGLDPNVHFKYPDKGIVPTQIIFCLKEKNQRKINSHRWFFNAFAPLLQPNVCVLLDVGTRPGNTSIYKLWKAFDVNSSVAGACGEIAVYKGPRWELLLNPLVAAQNFEYKISGILDKPTESMFGYISVLPGAFSAYRYIALQNDERGVGPLASYFKGEVLHGRDTDIFTSNMYRILCFELVAKANSSWVLKYVKGAIGETDVPDAVTEFISQRRRWLNGSFFAGTYAIAHVGQILRSGHSLQRRIMLLVETVYNIINLIFSWFSIGNFYLFFVVLTASLEDPSLHAEGIKYVNKLAQFILASTIVACFVFSMGNKPQGAKFKYMFTIVTLSIFMVYMLVASVVTALQAAQQGGSQNSAMLFSVVITFGLYALSSILALDPWHMLTSFIPYMLLSPMYINVLNMCISWGTKQDSIVEQDLGAVVQNNKLQVDVEIAEPSHFDNIYEQALSNLRHRKPAVPKGAQKPSEAEQEQMAKDYYANIRTNVLLSWTLSNALLVVLILSTGDPTKSLSENGTTKSYLVFILAFTAITNIVRFFGSTLYLIARLITG